MLIENGNTIHRVSPEDFNLTSISPDVIILPYVGTIWDDLRYEAYMMAVGLFSPEDIAMGYVPDYSDLIGEIKAFLRFEMTEHPYTYIELHVTTLRGQELQKNFRLVGWKGASEEMADITSEFFAQGSRGLRETVADEYIDRMLLYVKRRAPEKFAEIFG